MAWTLGAGAAWLLAAWSPGAAADETLWHQLRSGSQVLLIRHTVTTPGVGDPPGFALADCATQRNLTEIGRDDATRIGESLRKRNVPVGQVLSSPWCRCLETARLAFGRAEPWAALGNLFGGQGAAGPQVRAMRERVAAHRAKENLVLVSHGSTAAALTGVHPAPGEILVLTPLGKDGFRVAGRIPLGAL